MHTDHDQIRRMQLKDVFIQTASGIHFHPFAPKRADVDINDIAHALSHIARWNGHTKNHYSVATHSINVCNLLFRQGYNRKVQLIGLMHDASEAYFADVPTPIKEHLPGIVSLEHGIWNAIACKFDLPEQLPLSVKTADKIILIMEALTLLNNKPSWVTEEMAKIANVSGFVLKEGLVATQEKFDFLAIFQQLGGDL